MDAYLWLLPVVFPAIGFFWCCCPDCFTQCADGVQSYSVTMSGVAATSPASIYCESNSAGTTDCTRLNSTFIYDFASQSSFGTSVFCAFATDNTLTTICTGGLRGGSLTVTCNSSTQLATMGVSFPQAGTYNKTAIPPGDLDGPNTLTYNGAGRGTQCLWVNTVLCEPT